MATEPNTQIRVFTNVPFDIDYKHTAYFPSKASQENFFIQKRKYTYDEQYYQRINKNTIRVQQSAEDLVDCNYLSIINKNHGNRTFYAFITDITYINENTAEIKYEIDDIQSYLFAYDNNNLSEVIIGDSFVEREHTNTDAIGDNIIAEDFKPSEYIFNDYQPLSLKTYATGATKDMIDMSCVIAISEVGDNAPAVNGRIYDGIYSGSELYTFPVTDASSDVAIDTFLSVYRQKPDAVICIYYAPTAFITTYETNKVNSSFYAVQYDITLPHVTTAMTLNGYTPRNKKLYTYPYNYLHLDNGQGDAMCLRYEFFKSETPQGLPSFKPVRLVTEGNVTQPVSVRLRPVNYKGQVGYEAGTRPYQEALNTESLELANYPLCSWSYDAFKSWAAQNTVPAMLGAVSSLGQTAIASTYSVHPNATVGAGVLGTVSGLVSQIYTASIQADVTRGKTSNANGGVTNRTQQFYFGRCSVNEQDAKMIDDYFTMFGYAVKRVKKPELFRLATSYARPHWYYVKTVGANVYGHATATVLNHIKDILDKGITFWIDSVNYGDYSLNNAPQ